MSTSNPSKDRTPLELLSEQSLLRIVTENARVGLVMVSPERRYVYGNATYSEILGLPATPLVGQRLQDVLVGVYEDQVRPRLDRAFAGERVSYELRKPTPDGDRYYAVQYEPTQVDGAVALVVVVIVDITERRQTQVDSSRLAAIVESSEDAIVSKDLNGIITSWNAGAEKIFGYTASEMIGTSILRLIPDDRRDEERHILEQICLGRRVPHFETLRRTKSGNLIDISVAVSPLKDATGKVIGVSKVARDISARKQAELALREERNRAQRYLDTAEVILLGLDLQGRITVINRKGCDLLGRTEEELLGRLWRETCIPERLRQDFVEKFQNMVAGELSIVEIPILTKSGEERLIEWRTRLLCDDAGRTVGTFSSGTDITERNRAAEAVRTAQERMRFALQSAGAGIWDVDLKTGVVRMSENLEAHYGIKPGMFGGTVEAFIQAVHPEDREYVKKTIDKSVTNGGDFSIQHRALWPDGTVRWLSSAGRIHVDAQGQPVRGIGVSLDVTERRSLEEQYHQALKMDAVGRLAGGVAHDFNNLLTAILGYSQLLLLGFDEEDSRRADVMEIHKAGESAARLTRQLLTFSRKQIIEPTLIDLNVVLRNMQDMLTRLIGEDVEIILKLQPELGLVKADNGQVEQIIMNLAVNARDAMPEGGTLTLETCDVELDEIYASTHLSVTPGRYVGLTVSDTGIGMPPEVQARLFEPFFTTKERGKGTGLGLATVHGIVMRSGGRIGVYSEFGKGTVFTVYLPRVLPGGGDADAPSAISRRHSTGETVLVVEDADGLREMTKRMLESQGYKVLLAANAQEAFQMFLSSQVVDIVLTDVIMPGGSGPELYRRLAEQRTGLKVVYMSGYTESAIDRHGVLEPGCAFLHKPFTAQALVRKLREVLDRDGA